MLDDGGVVAAGEGAAGLPTWECGLPLVGSEGQGGGRLLVTRTGDTPPFDAHDERVLAAVTAQIGATIERARRRREVMEAETLRRADELKTALLNAVSHDLRTPLASIIASAGSLRQPGIDWTDEERRDFARTIEEEARRLDRIVGNLLDLSRIQGGSLHLDQDWHDLGLLVDDVVARLRPALAGHALATDVPDDLPPVCIDPVAIDQVLSNLIENAAKFSPPGTKVWIGARRGVGAIEVQVADRGPGIARHPAAPLHPLLPQTPRAVVARAAWERAGAGGGARAGGGAWRSDRGAESPRWRGALHLHDPPGDRAPRRGARAGRRAGRRVARVSAGRAGARILVVDDEPAILRVVRANLARHDFRVATAATGWEALDLFVTHRPDVILLDLGLPDIEGFAIIAQIRARATTPIIVLSARGSERDKVRALDLGADDYLTKPFGVDELLARVRVALRHAAGAGDDAIFRTSALAVDLMRRRVAVGEREIYLTPTEYELLKAFIEHPNRVLTTRMLLGRVWGDQSGVGDHHLHVYVARLRKKLAPDATGPRYLMTEPGVGYRLIAED